MPLSTITTPVPTLRSTSSPFSSMPMPRTRTTAGRMASNALAMREGRVLFSSVRITAASMSCWVSFARPRRVCRVEQDKRCAHRDARGKTERGAMPRQEVAQARRLLSGCYR